ncbi:MULTISPECIES: ATP-binding protein [Leptolyngbya]|uniref:ATP-binding protein n=1 Tax=Leptolyngbya TaxID=47251 RepID=UPI00168523A8|nr:ATP-binding protein [Leptolyngbya sp. FACHB-1624]MBD1856192.1 ATP-binding protein [Leptolyngbya sp. FACHB-1624]
MTLQHPNTVIAIAGSPHSGKSVFAAALYRQMLKRCSSGIFLDRVCPDGEGMWSSEANPDLVRSLRRKAPFSEEFIRIKLEHIDHMRSDSTLSIVLLDLGGKRSPENAQILAQTDYLLLVSQLAEISAWQSFAAAQGCKTLAILESRLQRHPDGALDFRVRSQIDLTSFPIVGILWNLDRQGDSVSYEPEISQLAEWILEQFDRPT